MNSYLKATPWDKRTFIIDTYELTDANQSALDETNNQNGHFTLKIDPLKNPQPIIQSGFYYTDSLIEPVCKKTDFIYFQNEKVSLTQEYRKSEIIKIAKETFIHGRFHRDFNIPNALADIRYMRWVEDLMNEKKLYTLLYEGKLAGFYGFDKDKVLLLGIKKEFQGKGLAKSFTSMGCKKQFEQGYSTLYTSISAANVASLNLFYSIGFKLKKTLDVYHKLTGPPPIEDK